ncbi:hypothetical protein H9649_07415 [Sporosarcina sp. Sa2YVA2]|uniref:Uncharacterized protein n=1 Tax=Sporosarcina quadrami TaxID=2762234 RepID=A0ABR8U8P2_9BACL|nr:pyocin knob domain-containing protein [Sporosarcina quadrami]MBD7984402.1 hypothetical protein [Sporosarcina quadrami]
MARYRTINVNLDRGYRNDLNANFSQIGIDITNMEAGLNTVVEDLIGGGFIESLTVARDNANAAATHANEEALYATTQGGYAKTQGDYANVQGDFAQQKGVYADEKAIAADQAAGNANLEAANLSALKIAVVDATQAANLGADEAVRAAMTAETVTIYTQEQGDYAKRQGDAVQDIFDSGLVASVNNKTGAVILTAADVGALPAGDYQPHSNMPVLDALSDVAGKLKYNGQDVGAVSSVNGKLPDGTGNVEIVIPDPDLTGLATKQELSSHTGNSEIHVKQEEKTKWNNAEVNAINFAKENGLGANLSSRTTSDADTAKTTGFYYAASSSGKLPAGVTDGALFVMSYDKNSWVTQVLIDWRSNKQYQRVCTNGVWSTWTEIGPLPDTGWINATLGAGWSFPSGGFLQYKKVGDLVCFRGFVESTNAGNYMTTMPFSYRPKGGTAAMSSTGKHVQVRSNGAVAYIANEIFYFDFVYSVG